MQPEPVTLTRERETLLITLACRAAESRMPNSLLQDRFAAETASRIDYDFARLDIDDDMAIGVAMRAHLLDGWTRSFLATTRAATVLHLGCGLDSRIFRIAPGPDTRWFDVDYPEVIALRRKLYPEREGCSMIGASVTSADWIAPIPADRPALVIAEGLLPYLSEDHVLSLLRRLADRLPSGEVIFDAYSSLGLRMIGWLPSIRRTGATLRWALDDPHTIEREIPRLQLVEDILAYDPRSYDERQLARLSWPARLAILTLATVPTFARLGRLLRYRFPPL